MIVLSLFNGMSCGEIALREVGIIPEVYYSSEIDKYAIAQTQLNFPNTIQLGSVVNVDVSKLKPIDLLIGGSPCQSFSFAGKRKGMATKCEIQITKLNQYLELKEQGFEFEGQSYLFWEYLRILTDIRKYNPDVKFLLENVEMGAKWERILSEAIGIFGVHINSNLVSAQNRARIYWTNIKVEKRGMFEELYSGIPQPEDRGILLKDILESEVDEKYYLSDKMLNYFDKRAANFNNGKVNIQEGEGKATTLKASMSACDISDNFILDNPNKSFCIDANYYKGGGLDNYINKSRRQLVFEEIISKDNTIMMQLGHGWNGGGEVAKDGKTPPLTKSGWEHNNLIMTKKSNIICHNTMPRSSKTGLGGTGHLSRNDGKTYCLDTGQTNAIEIQTSKIRRLTPTECARLQTIPEWYVWNCSDTQQYRMLGNGWTVSVISHIFSFLNN